MTVQSDKKKKAILWGAGGCLVLVLVVFCTALVITGIVLGPKLLATPTPAIVRSGFRVTVRYLDNVDSQRIGRLTARLESLGYELNVEPSVSTDGWSYPQTAFLHGAPSCLDAIDDINNQVIDIIDLSALPIFRFTTDDALYEEPSIVIQLLENIYWIP